jgi:rhamnose transport system permease protein
LVQEQAVGTPRTSWLQTVMRFREAGIIFIIVLLSVAVTLRSPAFLSLDNFRDILLTISILVIVALAQTMVIITRGIDLSVGSMIGLSAMMVSFIMVGFPDTSPVVAVLLGMGLGLVLGGINGVVIAYAGVPPIIATLGTLSIYRGLVFLYSDGNWVNAFEMPQAFRDLAKGTPLGVPNLIIFAAVTALAVFLFLKYTRMGRNIFAVGSNPDAATFAGIPVQRVLFTVYLISGLLCGLAGVLWASRFEAAQTNTALGFELQTVAAPVVGGVNVFGGSGSVVSVLLGAFLLGIINNALTLVRISPFWQLAAQGVLILVAVVADAAIMRRLQALTGRSRVS